MFSPLGLDEKDEIYRVMILMLQCAYHGPFPQKIVELSDGITMEVLDGIEGLVTQRGYRNTLTTKIRWEGVVFHDKFMKLDLRDQPSPQELLHDQLLSSVMKYSLSLLRHLIWMLLLTGAQRVHFMKGLVGMCQGS